MVSAAPGPAAAPPVTQKREFWVLMGYAVVLGVFGAFAGLVFIGVIKFGGKWYSDSDPGPTGRAARRAARRQMAATPAARRPRQP